MPSGDLIQEVDRQLTICNACRYCEGYCAVFPTMTNRREFATEDLVYMANLCFECRACYYACQFTPPHEYDINVPMVLSELRAETYKDYTWPSLLSKIFQGNQWAVGGVVAIFIALIFGSVLAVQGEVLFEANSAEGSFFEVIPYYAMVIPALIISGYGAIALLMGGWKFWRSTGATAGELFDVVSFSKATKDAFGLKYMKGGNQGGCFYPDRLTSNSRRYAHHLVFYGFLFMTASTTVAAIYHNLLGEDAPYPYLSLPVVLGTIGGVMTVLGVGGLFWLKSRQDLDPANDRMLQIDNVFLVMLLTTSLSGLILMVLRETALMGTLLTIHLGLVAGFFLTLPYGKFAHVIYRYAALIRYQVEQRQAVEQVRTH
jgi:citrate/tricarballylate utilization protein